MYAQSTGSIQGTVHDSTGAGVPRTAIEIRNNETGLSRQTETDASGFYAAASLPPGTYTVTVHAPNMSEARQENVILPVGRDIALSFSLKVATAETSVTVSGGEQTVLDTTSATQSQTLTPKVVQEVPLNGRHFIDLFPLVAGTVAPPQSGSLSAPTRGTGASGFNSAGYREDTTNLMVNGITHTDLQQS